MFPTLLSFFPTTLLITAVAIAIALSLGIVLAWGKISKNKVANSISNGYTMIIRGTPVLLLLFLIYYGSPFFFAIFGINLDNIPAIVFAIATFALDSAVYLSEDMKAAFRSVERGQMEAALSVGLSAPKALWRIVIPQTTTVFIPVFGNSIATMLKDTSIAYTIGVYDLIGSANRYSGLTFGKNKLEIYIGISIIYWVSVVIIDYLIRLYQKRTNRGVV